MLKRLQLWEVSQRGFLWLLYALFMVGFISVLLPCANAQTQVTIQNPSFETFNTLTNTWNQGPIPSWSSTSAAGQNLYGSWQPASSAFPSIPDGTTVAFSNGATLTQDLGFIPSVGDTYTLQAYIGRRGDNLSLIANYTVALFIGSSQLCAITGSNSGFTGGTFTPESCTGTVPANPAGDLIISLGSSAAQIVFDKVSLTVIAGGHSAALTWQDNVNPSGTTYNVYRSNGSPWNPILLANVSTKNYTDTTIVVGQTYTYKITAVVSGVESDGPFVAVALVVQ